MKKNLARKIDIACLFFLGTKLGIVPSMTDEEEENMRTLKIRTKFPYMFWVVKKYYTILTLNWDTLHVRWFGQPINPISMFLVANSGVPTVGVLVRSTLAVPIR